MLQFCRISTNAAPRCCAAALSTSSEPCLSVSIARATKRRLGPDRDREGVERLVDGAERRRLRHLPELRGRRVLAFRQPVDAVVEKEDRDVDVPPERMDQVVAADRQGVAVTGHDPHGQVRAGGCEARGDRRRAPVDRVHPVRLHVVREPGRAADPGDEHEVLPGNAELGEERLDAREDRVVAAARAPADLLVGLEVLRRQLDEAVPAVHAASAIVVIASSSSAALSGRPRTRLYETASTRNCARRSSASCPRFISGTRILG